MIDPGLINKVVLITGANNPLGIGAEAARVFARQGAKVFLTYFRLSPDAYGILSQEAQNATEPGDPYYHGLRMKSANEVVQSINNAGGKAASMEANLNDPRNISDLFDTVTSTFGQVDILVNNAASYHDPDNIFTFDLQYWTDTFAVNVRAPLLLVSEFLNRYKKRHGQWGRIINLSTDAAQAFVGQINYGASKAAMEAYTRSIAMEVGSLGVTVNTIAPGPVQTGYISEELETRILPDIPLQRIGEPADIANAILFLASVQADWITGQVIKVSGGHAL